MVDIVAVLVRAVQAHRPEVPGREEEASLSNIFNYSLCFNLILISLIIFIHHLSFHFLIRQPKEWPPPSLHDAPKALTDFVQKALQLHPSERISAVSALQHPFITPPALSVAVSAMGKNGMGTILEGHFSEEVVSYLQGCSKWGVYYEQFAPSKSMVEEEDRNLKAEFPSYVDKDAPPKCLDLNSDRVVPVLSERLAKVMKATKRKMRPLFQQLDKRIRDRVRNERLPEQLLGATGIDFQAEDFADNARTYVSPQLLRPEEREDGWHTDGAASLLHAALTVFGCRDLEVKTADGSTVVLPQKPGSFYIGNLCALSHNVRHDGNTADLYHPIGVDDPMKIAVMVRSDVFRHNRARRKNAKPSPAEFWRIVNEEVAKFFA